MNPWEQLEHEVELALHPAFADRLLDNVLESENIVGAYGTVADLVSVLSCAPTDAELAREEETVAEMVKIRRAAGRGGRTYGRKSLALVAAAAAMSTSVAWASGVPPVIQEATAQALAQVGVALKKARGQDADEGREAAGAREPAVQPSSAGSVSRRDEDLVVAGTRRHELGELAEESALGSSPAAAPEPAAAEESPPVSSNEPAPAPSASPPAPSSAPSPGPAGSDEGEPKAPPAGKEKEKGNGKDKPKDKEKDRGGSEDEVEVTTRVPTLPEEDAVAISDPSDEGEKGKPEDPGKPEDAGAPEAPGKPDDNGKPDDKGKPDKPDEPSGPPDDPGNPEEPQVDPPEALPPAPEGNNGNGDDKEKDKEKEKEKDKEKTKGD